MEGDISPLEVVESAMVWTKREKSGRASGTNEMLVVHLESGGGTQVKMNCYHRIHFPLLVEDVIRLSWSLEAAGFSTDLSEPFTGFENPSFMVV
jgi:hypothetical protein